ncbi:hypothetical protein D3C75_986590 [compost metagenome]
MRAEQDGSPRFLQIQHEIEQGTDTERIKSQKRLINNIECRPCHKGAHNHYLLLHTLGQMGGQCIHLVLHIEECSQLPGARFIVTSIHAVSPGSKFDMLPDRHFLIQQR